MDNVLKLYRVNLIGLNSSRVGSSYVVAYNTDEAYNRVRKELDKRNYGFYKDRELESIELLADNSKHGDTPWELFLPKKESETGDE